MLGQVTVNIIVSLEPIVWHLDQNLHRRHNYHANTCQVVDPYSFSFLLGIGRLRINRSNLLHSHSDPGNHHLCVIWLLHLFGLKRMLVNGRGCWPPPGLMWASGARLKPAVFMSNGSWSESSLSARAHIWGVSLAFTIGVHLSSYVTIFSCSSPSLYQRLPMLQGDACDVRRWAWTPIVKTNDTPQIWARALKELSDQLPWHKRQQVWFEHRLPISSLVEVQPLPSASILFTQVKHPYITQRWWCPGSEWECSRFDGD